jgi:hypothetical protein
MTVAWVTGVTGAGMTGVTGAGMTGAGMTATGMTVEGVTATGMTGVPQNSLPPQAGEMSAQPTEGAFGASVLAPFATPKGPHPALSHLWERVFGGGWEGPHPALSHLWERVSHARLRPVRFG